MSTSPVILREMSTSVTKMCTTFSTGWCTTLAGGPPSNSSMKFLTSSLAPSRLINGLNRRIAIVGTIAILPCKSMTVFNPAVFLV